MGKFHFLYSKAPLEEADLETAEQVALAGDSLLEQLCSRLLVEVRRLRHDLADPMYQYAGTRISRHALVCRDVENEKQRKDVIALQNELTAVRKALPTVPHSGGDLQKVVAHYADGSTQTIDGDVVTTAVTRKEVNS